MHRASTEKLLTLEILNNVAELFDIEPESVSHVGGFENTIYKGLRYKKPVVIRITHQEHRTASQLYSELHWLQFLKDKGADVCAPYPSKEGNLVETLVIENTPLHFGVFEMAPGSRVDMRKEKSNTQLFEVWGQATGKLHRLTKDYKRPEDVLAREDDVDNFYKTLDHLIPDKPGLRDRVQEIVQEVNNMPRSPEFYDLIHSDIHSANFFYDGTKLHIFDFDDCCYHQLASDIAIPLFYAVWFNDFKTQEEKDQFGQLFIEHFIQGYIKETSLSPEQIATIPALLMLRDVVLFAVLVDEFRDNLNEKRQAILDEFMDRIMNNKLIVNINWRKLPIKQDSTR